MRIGITGGIGSGKSTVARLFALLGIPVYYADAEAKRLMMVDATLRASIIELFGPESYMGPGASLDRAYLSARAFADPRLTARLNTLVHPAVEQDYERWASLPRPGVAYTLKEAALLFEAGTYKRVDKVIAVAAPEALRVARTLARDKGRSAAQVQSILARQMPEAERLARADYILTNDDIRALIPQMLTLHKVFCAG